MSEATSAREEILARIRAALPGDSANVAESHAAIGRNYRRTAALDRAATLELLIDRLLDYDAEVQQVSAEADLPAAIARALQHAGEHRVIVAAGFPTAWLPAGFSIAVDHDLSTEAIDKAEAAVTTCEAAVAASGTLFLVHANMVHTKTVHNGTGPSGGQGRRVITLLPDHHICLVRRDQVFELLPEALAAVAPKSALPITTISGPSATSDIEMTRVRGVHGPRRLTVIFYGRSLPSGAAG